MADWLDEIDREFRRAGQSNHPGRIRTAARRIAGIALRQLPELQRQDSASGDYVRNLRLFMEMSEFPEEVRAAAARLQAQLSGDFSSPSKDPIGDAATIVDFVKEILRRGTSLK